MTFVVWIPEEAPEAADPSLASLQGRKEREKKVSVNKSGSPLFGVGAGKEKQETPKKL